MLKLRQREDALARGIDLIEWTFDPLEIKNAFFNIERLGAIVRRYVENQYGTTSSPLHGGLPTDRCTAEWWMASDRVQADSGRESRPIAALSKSGSKCPPTSPRSASTDPSARAKSRRASRGSSIGMLRRAASPSSASSARDEAGVYLLGPWP